MATCHSSEGDVDLISMFQIRQSFRVQVVSSLEPANSKSSSGSKNVKMRIKLSLDPAMASSSLTSTDLVVGCTVQDSVTSVEEDDGLVMNPGIGDDLKGFLPSQGAREGQFSDRCKGRAINALFAQSSGSRRMVKSSNSQGIQNTEHIRGVNTLVGRQLGGWVTRPQLIHFYLELA